MQPSRAGVFPRYGGLMFLISALAISLAVNVSLGWKVRLLRAGPPRFDVRPNVVLPGIPVVDSAGNRQMLGFVSERPTVLYVLSPSCSWCEQDLDNIRALSRLRGDSYRFVGVSVDDLSRKAGQAPPTKDMSLPFEVFWIDSRELARELGLLLTPQTVLITADGRVDKVWPGALFGSRLAEAERTFGVKLPGTRARVTF